MIEEPTLRERTLNLEEILAHRLAEGTKLKYVTAGLIKFLVNKGYVSRDEMNEMIAQADKMLIKDGLMIKP